MATKSTTKKTKKRSKRTLKGAYNFPVEKSTIGDFIGAKYEGLAMRESDAMRGETARNEASSAEFSSRNTLVTRWSGFSPREFGYLRQAYTKGDYRNCMPILETIMEMDDRLLAVSQKRYQAISCLDYEIQPVDGVAENDRLMKQQKEVMRDFFNTFTFENIMRRDSTQGVSGFINWMMNAICFGYSACTLQLVPCYTQEGRASVKGRATGVPLKFFEAKRRFLALRRNWQDEDGEPLDKYAWVVLACPQTPLIMASAMLFMFKSTPLEDWAHVVEKFGQPLIIAKTSATKSSSEWNQLGAVLQTMGSNFSGVFSKSIDIDTKTLAQGNAPHEALIEHIDTAIGILWRGGDLSTQGISSWGQQSSGVTLQSEERDAILKSDKRMMEELIDTQITQRVLGTVFGYDTPQKVYFKFSCSENGEVSSAIQKLKAAQELGLEVPKKWAYASLNIAPPSEEEEILPLSLNSENEAKKDEPID